MLLGEPAPTSYDVHFSCFGYPVRISVWFWLAGLIFGSRMITSLGIPPWQGYLLWTTAILVSILIHELGHCLAFRKYGLSSRIVLYHFGGLAIPSAWAGHRSTNRSPWHQVEISAAGPLLQIVSALVLAVGLGLCGYNTPLGFGFVGQFFAKLLTQWGLNDGKPLLLLSPNLHWFVFFYMYVSICWGVFNLLPIYPLDGGNIARNLAVGFFGNETIRYTLMLSIAVAAYIAFNRYQGGDVFMAFMFASFAYSNYQALQSTRGSYRPY